MGSGDYCRGLMRLELRRMRAIMTTVPRPWRSCARSATLTAPSTIFGKPDGPLDELDELLRACAGGFVARCCCSAVRSARNAVVPAPRGAAGRRPCACAGTTAFRALRTALRQHRATTRQRRRAAARPARPAGRRTSRKIVEERSAPRCARSCATAFGTVVSWSRAYAISSKNASSAAANRRTPATSAVDVKSVRIEVQTAGTRPA